MAKTRKEICEKSFRAHEKVLNEIFQCMKSESFEVATSEGRKQFLAVGLDNLVEAKLLSLSDVLYSDYKGKHREATLSRNASQEVVIQLGGKEFESPSGTAIVSAGVKAMNGWDYWSVKDSTGRDKGMLSELRRKFTDSLSAASRTEA